MKNSTQNILPVTSAAAAAGISEEAIWEMVSRGNATVDLPLDAESDDAPLNLFTIKSGNAWCVEALHRPDPTPLWMSMWYEGEISCLFADSNLGKSIYAVEIAEHIAKSQKVIYFDFELSDKQFQLRYTDPLHGLHQFPDNFLRAEIDTEALTKGDVDIESEVISAIERVCVEQGVKVMIIDNLSFLCNSADKSDLAGRLMMQLLDLKKRRDFSILVLAHTPKRPLTSPITQNDLAGSKKLFNFFDSVFAIGRSAQDEKIRYIKQIKVRAGEFEYGGDNVILSEIVKEGNWLHFSNFGYGAEREHLQEPTKKNNDELAAKIRADKESGMTWIQIAAKYGISKSKAHRLGGE